MKIKYCFIPEFDFKAEYRLFKRGESYPIYENGDYFILMAENGEFNLAKKALNKTMSNWRRMGVFKPVEAQHGENS